MKNFTFLILCNILLVRGMKENEPCTGTFHRHKYRGRYRIDRYTFNRMSQLDDRIEDEPDKVQFGCPADVDVGMYSTSPDRECANCACVMVAGCCTCFFLLTNNFSG